MFCFKIDLHGCQGPTFELAAWDEDDAEDDFVVFALLDQPERRAYEGQFALDHFTAIECEDLFRFSAEEIRRPCALLGMQRTMQAPNGMNNQGTKASGLEVLCICLRRLAYPCRFADLSQMFHRPKPELCVLFKRWPNLLPGRLVGVQNMVDNPVCNYKYLVKCNWRGRS
ncbi:uncharacterized protein [Littorina saxatilis]|uniref:uncharacterized protein isoform X2 n=1 Tax=Littorina saxatilis TaxID=31220 RepID=UPI0038B62A40